MMNGRSVHLRRAGINRASGQACTQGGKGITCSLLSRSAAPLRDRIDCGFMNKLPAIILHVRKYISDACRLYVPASAYHMPVMTLHESKWILDAWKGSACQKVHIICLERLCMPDNAHLQSV